MFSFCAHSVVRAGRTSMTLATTTCLPLAICLPMESMSTSLPVTAGTTDTAVPLIANPASFGGVSSETSCWPNAARSFNGSVFSTSRDFTISVCNEGATCSGESSNGALLTVTRDGGGEDAAGQARGAVDVLGIDGRRRGADRELAGVALALTECVEHLLPDLGPLDADARLRRDLDHLRALELQPAVDESLPGLRDPGVEDRVEAAGFDVDHERDVVGAEPPQHGSGELVDGVVASAGFTSGTDARGGVDVQVRARSGPPRARCRRRGP